MSTHTSSLCRGVGQKRKGRKGDRKEKMRKKNKRERAGTGKGGEHAGICVRGQDEFKRRDVVKGRPSSLGWRPRRSAHHASGRQITGLQDTHPRRISHSPDLRHL